jgi:ABC-type hemin transport system substrate-binding protein
MHPPERIVCLTEETTETLYLLGEAHRIVGISGYNRPATANAQGETARLGIHLRRYPQNPRSRT